MKLADYLKATNTSMSDMADSIGVKVPSVHRYAAGQRIPHPDIMAKVVSATKGAVQPNDFYPAPAAE